jgi:hypothetical protein
MCRCWTGLGEDVLEDREFRTPRVCDVRGELVRGERGDRSARPSVDLHIENLNAWRSGDRIERAFDTLTRCR